MQKILLLPVFLLCLVVVAQAQCGFGHVAKMRGLVHRELIVIVEQPSQRIIELMKKRKKTNEQLAGYEAVVADYNAAFRQSVEKYWRWDSSATFMTMNDADRFRKTQAKNYAVLYCTTIDNFMSQGDAGGRNFQRVAFPEDYKSLNHAREHWNSYTVMEIKFLEDLAKSEPVFRQNLPNIIPEKSDLTLGVQAVRHYLMDSTLRPKPEAYEWQDVLPAAEMDMQSKTLLLRKDWLAAGLNHDKIKDVYPYPFIIVDGKRFNESAMRGNPNLALLEIVPEVQSKRQKIVTNYLHAIIDSMTGLPLGYTLLKAEDGKDKYISRESMKDLAQYLKRREAVLGNKARTQD